MLGVKSTLHVYQPSNFDLLNTVNKCIHTKPSKLYIQLLERKECPIRQSQACSRRIKQTQNRKSEVFFSNCALFQAKRAKIKQIYQRNHSSGWLQKILAKKYFDDKQQPCFNKEPEKMMKISCYEQNPFSQRSPFKMQPIIENKVVIESKVVIENKVAQKGLKLESQGREHRKSLKKINHKRRIYNVRLTQPSECVLKKKQLIIKDFRNETDINLSPWGDQYAQ